MTRESLEELKAFLRVHEGVRTCPYKCTNGYMTIGIGHNTDSSPLPPYIQRYLNTNGYITQEMVEDLFTADLNTAINSCQRLYPPFDVFPESVKIALVDLMFNLGYGRLKRDFAPTVTHINKQQWGEVIDHLQKSKWYAQVGNRAKDVVKEIKEA